MRTLRLANEAPRLNYHRYYITLIIIIIICRKPYSLRTQLTKTSLINALDNVNEMRRDIHLKSGFLYFSLNCAQLEQLLHILQQHIRTFFISPVQSFE